jgi:hypothetical protein
MSDLRFDALLALTAVVAVVACSAAYSDTQPAAAPHYDPDGFAAALSCDVTAEPTARGVLIEAHAYAHEDVDGEFDLVITKSGGGGSSDVNQGGALVLAAGAEETLGQTELSVERGALVTARLVVRDAQGELCRRSFRL